MGYPWKAVTKMLNSCLSVEMSASSVSIYISWPFAEATERPVAVAEEALAVEEVAICVHWLLQTQNVVHGWGFACSVFWGIFSISTVTKHNVQKHACSMSKILLCVLKCALQTVKSVVAACWRIGARGMTFETFRSCAAETSLVSSSRHI